MVSWVNAHIKYFIVKLWIFISLVIGCFLIISCIVIFIFFVLVKRLSIYYYYFKFFYYARFARLGSLR